MKITSKIFIVFALMCVSATAAYSQDCNSYLQQATKLVSQKKYSEAKKFYQKYSDCNADADVSTEIAMCDIMASKEIGTGGKTEGDNPPPPITPKGDQNIVTENLNVGNSDIDVNIPINKNSNDKTFAVIIANENYRREAQVIFAKNDGETFGKYCIQTLGLPEKNVHLVTDATLNDIRAEVNWISNVADIFKGEANIIFYYAGHGIPDGSSGTSYLLPIDGYDSDVTTGYKLSSLYSKLGALPAKNITVFIDACFSGAQRSGGMLASARSVAIRALEGKPVGNMVVFSAAQGDETAFPYYEKKHGMFTYFLLKKLQESKGEATLSELGDYIISNVRQQSIIVNSKNQTPTVTASVSIGDKWQGLKLK